MDNGKLKNFIAEKIDDIKYAIFYCHSNSQLHINNAVISSSKVDENGRISFFVNRPPQLLSQFDQEFPVRLNYFQKGKNYFMNISGQAHIVNDPEELAYQTNFSKDEINESRTTKALILVTISKVDFYDTNYERKNLFFKKILSFVSSLFDWFGSASRSYNFGEPASLHHYGF